MSRHTWLSKPTMYKAGLLETAWRVARNELLMPKQVPLTVYDQQVFAGYYLESAIQKGTGRRHERINRPAEFLKASRAAGLRFLRGVNVENYAMTFRRHRPLLWALFFSDFRRSFPEAPFPAEVEMSHWFAVHDWLEENGHDFNAQWIADMFDDSMKSSLKPRRRKK